MTCKTLDCPNEPLPGQVRCSKHQLRWLPGKPVERPIESPWVRKARAGALPPKVLV